MLLGRRDMAKLRSYLAIRLFESFRVYNFMTLPFAVPLIVRPVEWRELILFALTIIRATRFAILNAKLPIIHAFHHSANMYEVCTPS